jgi:histidinol-phosphate aminotransferase
MTAGGNPFPSTEMVQRRTGIAVRARLSANENEFGPPPEAVAAIVAAAGEANRYPDCDHHDLRAALAALHGVPAECLLVAAGIDGLLSAVHRTLLGPGRTLVTVAGTYPTMAYFAAAGGTTVRAVPYAGHRADPAALLAAAGTADVLYLVEPDNPTGTDLGREEVLRLADRLPGRTVLVVDGAYAEYQSERRRLRTADLRGRRVLWLRTFSKAYGLAGMRIGYAVGSPDLLAGLERGSEHYAAGRLASVAALAAVRAQARLAEVLRATAAGRERLRAELAGIGLAVLPGETNFVAVRCPGGATQAERLRAALAEQGVLVRRPDAPGVDDLLRITVGPPAQVDLVLALLAGELAGSGRS